MKSNVGGIDKIIRILAGVALIAWALMGGPVWAWIGVVPLATGSNALGDINPADIENMEVLKDGSATAIYGSRAAAGLILITTKRGTKGRGIVSFDASIGFNNALKRFDVLNAQEFVMIVNEKLANAGQALRANMDPAQTNTNWQDQVMVNNAAVHNHTLSAQGGTEKTSYYMSLNYSQQQGIIITNFNKAYRARLNVNTKQTSTLKWVTTSRLAAKTTETKTTVQTP